MVESVRSTTNTQGSRGRRRGSQQVSRTQNRSSRAVDSTSLNQTPENCEATEIVAQNKSTTIQELTGTPLNGLRNDVDACIICASDIIHESFGPCNHRTCHVCSIRMRVLFKDQTCTLCRTFAPYIIITDNRNKPFEEYTDEYFRGLNFQSIDDKIGLRFESVNIREDVLWMLGYNCPEKGCDVACLAWPHLHDHTRKAHGKKICGLCSKHRKIFPHEHDLFTDAELSKHIKKGDNDPKSISQSGFKGHPLCNFCGNRYFGDDELFQHLRENHERCFVCDRADPGKSPSYYVNYETLRQHFVKDHFICKMKDCLDQKYIVFVSEFELKAHMLEVHGDVLPKDAIRDARNIDISDFSYRRPYEQERRGISVQRHDRERGRGRELAVESVASATPQPLRRDEQAYLRQLAIRSSQSTTSMNLGHQTTTSTANDSRVKEPRAIEPPKTVAKMQSQILNSSDGPTLVQASFSLPERVRSLRHAAINEQVSLLLKRDSFKISRFQSSLLEYVDGKTNVRSLIEEFFSIFAEISSSALGNLVKEISDSVEDSKKADELRSAWNNWRAINEDYPSLPVASNSAEGSGLLKWATRNGNVSSLSPSKSSSIRAAKSKKSAMHSAASFSSQTRSWDSVSRPNDAIGEGSNTRINDNLNDFPSLRSQDNKNTSATCKIQTTPWASTTSQTSNSLPHNSERFQSSDKKVCNISGGISSRLKMGTDAFPALPILPKPQEKSLDQTNILAKRTLEYSSENAWKGNGQASSGRRSVHENATNEAESSKQGKKKGNKSKKQVLIGWG